MSYTPHHNDCRNPRYYVTADGEYKRRPCASRWCHNAKCRQAWAKKETCILLKSFATLPPTHFVVLSSKGFTGPEDCRKALRRFLGRLRRHGALEYKWWIEPARSGRPHAHILLRTTTAFARKRIRSAADDNRVYFKPVRSVGGSARYVTKFECRMPAIPNRWTRPLSGHSKGFYTRAKADLWQEVKADWFSPPV